MVITLKQLPPAWLEGGLDFGCCLPSEGTYWLYDIKQNAKSAPRRAVAGTVPVKIMSLLFADAAWLTRRGAMPGRAPLPLKCAELGKHGL